MSTIRDHLSVEAFALMKYASVDGREVEWIWNARDGVTPFCVLSRSGKEMRHVDWHLDRYLPQYEPLSGERVFVDLTEEKARQYAERRVAEYWDHADYPMRGMFGSREEAITALVADMMSQPGSPDLIEADDVHSVEVQP